MDGVDELDDGRFTKGCMKEWEDGVGWSEG